jgi:hypothetical protein
MYDIHSQVDPENVTSRMDVCAPLFETYAAESIQTRGEGLNQRKHSGSEDSDRV